jgi:hypothetical protein
MQHAHEVAMHSIVWGVWREISHLADLLSSLCVHCGCIYVALPCANSSD